jgi:hypothetical protein
MAIKRFPVVGGLIWVLSFCLAVFLVSRNNIKYLLKYPWYDFVWALIVFCGGYLITALVQLLFRKVKEDHSVVYFLLGWVIIVLNVFFIIMMIGNAVKPMH